MWIETSIHKHVVQLSVSGKPILSLPYYLEIDGRARLADSIQADGLQVHARWGECTISDVIERNGAMLTVRRRWNLLGRFRARLWFDVVRRMAPIGCMAPGVLYHVDAEDRPRQFWGRRIPEELTTVPSCVVIEDRRSCFSVFTRPAESVEEYSAARAWSSGEFVNVALSVPGSSFWTVDGHLAYERIFYIYLGERPATPGRPIVEAAWDLFGPAGTPTAGDWGPAAARRASFAFNHFYIERADAVGAVSRLSLRHFPHPVRLEAESNLEAALALYRVGLETDMKPLRRIALDVADFFIASGEAGLAPEYRLARRRWAKASDTELSLVGGYGAAAWNLLRLHQAASPRGDANDRWLLFVRKVCNWLITHQRDDGALVLPPQGQAATDLNALNGIWALADAGEILAEQTYLDAAERAMERYLPFIDRWAFFEADTTVASRDLAGSAIRALRFLYRRTGRGPYLEAAERAAHFLLTWIYPYDLPLDEATPAGRRSINVSGAARLLSDSNAFDFQGLRWTPELLHLADFTQNPRWRRIAEAQLHFAAQLWSENGHPLMRGLFSSDFQPDFVRVSPHGRRGAVEGISLPTTIRTLLSLLDIRDTFPNVLHFTVPPFSLDKPHMTTFGQAIVYAAGLVGIW